MKRVINLNPKTSSLISNLIYILLNLILAFMVVLSVNLLESPWLAIIIIILGKWRVVAVNIRFWWANILANLLDFLVGLSYVLLTLFVSTKESAFYPQMFLLVLYMVWLLIIKPANKIKMVIAQCLIALFVSNVVLSLYGSDLPIALFVAIEIIISYSVMRHYLVNCNYENKYIKLMSGIWALLCGQMAWVYWHWTMSYLLFGLVNISQFAITTTAVTFLSFKVLQYSSNDFVINRKNLIIDLTISAVFVIFLIFVMLLFFSKPLINV